MSAGTKPALFVFEKVLKVAVTTAVVSAAVSPNAGWITYMVMAPGLVTAKRMVCLRSQPICVQFFVWVYFVSCFFIIQHLYFCWIRDAMEGRLVGILPLFVYCVLVVSDATTFNSLFAAGTDLLVTHVANGKSRAFIVHSNVELDSQQLECLRRKFSDQTIYTPLALRAVQFVAQRDGSCEPRVSHWCVPRRGEKLSKFVFRDGLKMVDLVLTEAPMLLVVAVVALNTWLEQITDGGLSFLLLALLAVAVCAFNVDGWIHKTCDAVRGIPVPTRIEVRNRLLSWTGSVARGATRCGKFLRTWTSWMACSVLRGCAWAALACVAMALGVCTTVAVYTSALAVLINAVLFAARVVAAWQTLDESGRACFNSVSLCVSMLSLTRVHVVRCSVGSAVSGGACLLEAVARSGASLSLAGKDAAAVVAAVCVSAAASPVRTLVLSARAVARILVTEIRKANPAAARVAQLAYPRCDLEFLERVEREVIGTGGDGVPVVAAVTTRPPTPRPL